MKGYYQKLTDLQNKQLLRIVIIAYLVFFLIILFVFIPTSSIIAETGYTTSDLQMAASPEEVEDILVSWEDILLVVYLQYLGDYIFLISGFIGNCGIFVLLGKYIRDKGNLNIPFAGFIAVFISRGLDAVENTLTLIIVTLPGSYPRSILSVLPVVPLLKFTFVGIVYSLMIIILIYILYLHRKQENLT